VRGGPLRAARVGDEIGGHTVSGHVHTQAKIVEQVDSENNRKVGGHLAVSYTLFITLT